MFHFLKIQFLASIVCLTIVPLYSFAQVSAKQAEDANGFFVMAVKTYRDANGLSTDQANKKYDIVRHLFEQIVVAYPSSKPSQTILSEDAPAGVDKQKIGFVAGAAGTSEITDGALAVARELLTKYEGNLTTINAVANAADFAILSWAAYGDSTALEAAEKIGWRPLKNYSGDQILVGDAHATLFRSGTGEHVLAFRGTKQLRDWVTNIGGTISWSPLLYDQVNEAVAIAQEVVSEFPSVVFTGHSLGGRFAQVASLKSGNRAIAFNSAPVAAKDLVVHGFGELLDGSIERFRSPQDQLTGLFSPLDVEITNVEKVEAALLSNMINAKDYTHAMSVLAKAAQAVQTARDGGWITAALKATSQSPINRQTKSTHSSGRLCKSAGEPFEVGNLKQLLWGSRISGTNATGKHWTEYLARGGDVANTIFVNAVGKETIGVYKFRADQVCFSYGAVAIWNCKTISKCESNEAPWVITDLQGNQTSLIHEVEPYGHVGYHMHRWNDLASKQELVVPYDGAGPRSYTPIPLAMSASARELERLFSGPSLTSKVEEGDCRFSVFQTNPIVNKYLQDGGWKEWMGGSSNVVGQQTQTWTVHLENYDPGLSQSGSANGHTVINPKSGKSFSMKKTVRRTDDPSLNSDQTHAIGGFSFTGLNTPRVNALLKDLSDVCAGRKAPKSFQNGRDATGMGDQKAGIQSTSRSNTHRCSSIDNDIARLQCFDEDFPKGKVGAASTPSLSENELKALHSIMNFNYDRVTFKGSLSGCTLYLSSATNSVLRSIVVDLSILDIEKTGDIFQGPTGPGELMVQFVAKLGHQYSIRQELVGYRTSYFDNRVAEFAVAGDIASARDASELIKKLARSCQ